MANKDWIRTAIKRPGQLHRDLGVPEDEQIPVEDLKVAAQAPGKVGKRARLALLLQRFRKKKGHPEKKSQGAS